MKTVKISLNPDLFNICKFAKSNAIVLVNKNSTIGIGSGQPSRLDSCKIASQKALKYLLKSNQEKPLQPDTLNYLGFTSRKLGDFVKGEEYYLLGLQIEPQHKGINEYLGELYVATNIIDLAKERLEILVNCNCEEYSELKEIIDGTKQSKY